MVGDEIMLVAVPNTTAAFKRLDKMSGRAWNDWKTGLEKVTTATEDSRILHLQDIDAFIQTASVAFRCKLAAFKKYQINTVAAGKHSALAEIDSRVHKRVKASYKPPTLDSVIPLGITQHFPWSDSAKGARAEESEARNAYYGKVKTMIDVRILADNSIHWSRKLKLIIVKSFERDIAETPEGVLMANPFLASKFSLLREVVHPGMGRNHRGGNCDGLGAKYKSCIQEA